MTEHPLAASQGILHLRNLELSECDLEKIHSEALVLPRLEEGFGVVGGGLELKESLSIFDRM